MKVKQLRIRNFRNIREAVFTPDERVNFLVGANGQGKTSVLEALGYLSSLRSFREAKTASVMQYGCRESEVACTLEAEEGGSTLSAELRVFFEEHDSKASKVAFINNKVFKSSTQYFLQRFGSFELGFHAIVFNPSDHEIVRGDPALRRVYLNRVLTAERAEYLKIFQKYQRTLEQRNLLLKDRSQQRSPLFLSFTEQLCQYGVYLTIQRLNWIRRLNQILPERLFQIAPHQAVLRVGYLSQWLPEIENLSFNNNGLGPVHFTGQASLPSLELLEQAFWARVSAYEAAEWKTGHSLVGPHRDDWMFFLGEQPLKGHGSQGEVRSALLALKLAELELFRNETGHRPLFLLDDFSSELDLERRNYLMRFLEETDLQTFVSTTEGRYSVGKRYWVRNGVVEEEGSHDYRTQSVE